MKTKKINKKLVLAKKTIANLSGTEMNVQRGGAPSDICTLYSPRCEGITKRDCPLTEAPICNTEECDTIAATICQSPCQLRTQDANPDCS